MATYENTISILIKATDAASSVLKATAGEAEGLSSSLQRAGETASSTGASLTKGLTLPLVAVGAEAVKMATNFQQTMEMLHTNAGVAQADLAGMSDAILKMSGQVGQSPEQLATAMYHIASAGQGIFTSSQMLDQLRVAAEGAAVGQANLDDTTYALTSTLAANVKGATDYNQTMGTLLAIVGSGDMKLQDLNDVIGTGLMGTLSSFGVSLQSAGAALADLGDNGEKGAIAGTRLRMMLTLMASPSKAAAKILGDLGLTTNDAASSMNAMNSVFAATGLTTTRLADDLRQPNGIYVALMDLKDHLDQSKMSVSQMDSVLAKAFGGGRTDAALLQLLDTSTRLDTKFQTITNDSGNFADNWATQQQTAAQKFHDAWAGTEADLVRLGQDLLPVAIQLVQTLGRYANDLASDWERLSPAQKQIVEDFAEFAIVAGPGLTIFGKFLGMFGTSISIFEGAGNGLLKIVGLLRGTGGIAGAAAEAGDAMATIGGGGAVAGAGLLGALGPLAIGIGAVGLAAGGAYLLVKHFAQANNNLDGSLHGPLLPGVQQYDNLAKALGVTLKGTGANATFLALAQTNVATAHSMVAAAISQVTQATNTYKQSQAGLKTAQDGVVSSQQNVQKTLSTFPTSSSQYKQAVDDAKGKTLDYDSALQNTARDALDLYNKQGLLKQAYGIWKGAVNDLTTVHDYLNSAVTKTPGLIAKLGPAAVSQVGAVDTLQAHVAAVVGTWNGLVANFGTQNLNLNQGLQGLGSTLDRLQNQSSLLNSTLHASSHSAIELQGAMGSIQGGSNTSTSGIGLSVEQMAGIQGYAGGTDFAPGGYALVGENGPELVNLPRGAQVIPTNQSQQILDSSARSVQGGAGATTINLSVNVGNYMGSPLDQQNLAKTLWQQLQVIARQHGVQSLLPNIGIQPL